MNQALLTRLFKSIEGEPGSPLIKIAYSIIEDEKRKGHTGLADKLNSILENSIFKQENYKPTLKVTRELEFKVPLDRRYRLPLATHVEHEYLRHDMVLSAKVENKILRIEKEYLARERLAHHGLKPRKKILLH